MKTTWPFHVCTWLMLALVSLGCSKQNEALKVKNLPGYQEQLSIYPHPVTWKNQHMDIIASKKMAEASCLTCHKSNPGVPLVVGCAMSCHKSNSENLPLKQTPTPVFNQCTTCHADVTDNKFAHYPANAGLCSTCHTVSSKHLSGETDKPVTKNTAADCYRCHTSKETGSTVHGALQDSTSCITCHNPHGGAQRAFIKEASVQLLCLGCHDVNVDTAVKHGPAVDQKSCVNCHSPHSSNNKKLLKLPSKDLCLSCHDKEIPATLSEVRVIPNIKAKMAGTQHTGAMGDCTDCHSPHGSANKRILTENYSTEDSNDYPGTGKNPYGMCFTCHDSGMLNKPAAPQESHHWSDVVESNVSCRNCHDPHGSN